MNETGNSKRAANRSAAESLAAAYTDPKALPVNMSKAKALIRENRSRKRLILPTQPGSPLQRIGWNRDQVAAAVVSQKLIIRPTQPGSPLEKIGLTRDQVIEAAARNSKEAAPLQKIGLYRARVSQSLGVSPFRGVVRYKARVYMTPEIIAEIKGRRLKGDKVTDIAKEMGLNPATIYRHLPNLHANN